MSIKTVIRCFGVLLGMRGEVANLLANVRGRAAMRANAITPIVQVLSAEDLRSIAEILRAPAYEFPAP
jgi:hypothetical protein